MKQKISNKKKTGEEKTQENPVAVEMKQVTPGVIQNIGLSMIACSPFNPRKYRPEEDLEELKASIAGFGIIQPVTLRPKEAGYEIVCGERRYRASLLAGLSTIPAIVRDCSDGEAMEICILENLQRRDINPVEEAVSFGKLMEVRGYSIEDLVRQFGKTDKYIRSRLQLRNLVEEVSGLLAGEEITLGVALELARFCPDIQKEVYRERLGNDSYSWKRLQTGEFRKMLEKGYSTDLSNYEFDKSDCKGCRFNSSVYDLFADGNCGSCQNMECLRYRQAGYMAAEATKLLNERKNAAICIAPESFASAEVVNSLVDTGCEIYEMAASRLPVEPQKPEPEQFESEAGYRKAEAEYNSRLLQYRAHSEQIETMVEQGRAQLLVDVSRRKPELCYRVLPEAQAAQPEEKDTVEKLRRQDRRNREIAIEKAVEDVKRMLGENSIPEVEFQPLEDGLVYYIMLSSLRKENYAKLGLGNRYTLSDEEKAGITASLFAEQKNIIRRDFIVKYLSDTSGDCPQSHMLLEFAGLHFPNRVKQIKEQYNEVYKRRHVRIEERIRELQPFTDKQEAAETAETAVAEPVAVNEEQPENLPAVPETVETGVEETSGPGTFDEPDMDDIPLYPGLPEQARIGEIPEEEEELLDTVYEEIAA